MTESDVRWNEKSDLKIEFSSSQFPPPHSQPTRSLAHHYRNRNEIYFARIFPRFFWHHTA